MNEIRRRVMVLGGGDSGGYVDLGLPSGLLWAVGNLVKDSQGNYSIGAETDWGTYISWGNIDGHNEGEGYDFSDTTYNSTPGKALKASIPKGDAAHDICLARLSAPWHLPTKEDSKELYDNTDREWTTINGVNGWKFMKKTDHSVYVFFPASGYYYGTSVTHGNAGYYWSSSFKDSNNAYILYFSSSSVNPQHNSYRRDGLTIRPICKGFTDITITLDPTDSSSVSGVQVKVVDSEGNEHTGTTNAQGTATISSVVYGSASVSTATHNLTPSTITVSGSSKAFTLDCELNYVDLGLPSGLLWAKGNITKDASGNYYMAGETEYGAYFSWGNIDGHRVAGQTDSYSFSSSNYNSTAGKSLTADIPTDATYDAARARLGGFWKIPSKSEYEELINNCTWTWKASGNSDYNGVTGYEVTGQNGNKIFLPCAGMYDSATLYNDDTHAYYQSTQYVSSSNAYILYFSNTTKYLRSFDRYKGYTIRACQLPHQDITITLNPTDQSSVSGVAVTVTDSEGTSQTATANANGQVSFSGVANGSATVSAEGYSITTNSTFTVSANATSFTCNCFYLPLGVWAYYSDGSLKSEAEADTNAIGVAVVTANCAFVIDKLATNSDNTIRYGGYNKNLSSIGVVVTSDAATAKLDFDGEGNTTKIITALSGYNDGYVTGAPACEACRAAFGGNGYMGSLGEWNEAYANKASVDSMMTKIGGTAISTSSYHWASTLYNASTSSWILHWSDGYTSDDYRYSSYYRVRAFRAL